MHGSAYTAEDIKRYLRGGMSPAEMHALEKAALDDPFLADAIEGMEKSPGHFENDIAELQKRIKPVKTKPAINIYRVAAAAILLVAATAAALVLLINEKQVQPEAKVLAKVEQKKDSAIVLQHADEPAAFKPVEKKQEKAKPAAPVPSALKDEELMARQDQAFAVPQAEKSINIADSVQQRNVRNDTPAFKELEGRAAGVDISGDTELNEVVVTGYSAKKRTSKRYTGASVEVRNQQSVAPEGGWYAFDNYLSENKNISGSDSLKTGTEIISFTIDKNGRPVDFKVRKSISPGHDAETIRLLQNGPDWQVLQGKKRKVRLEIVF